jgi:hypothetical protein
MKAGYAAQPLPPPAAALGTDVTHYVAYCITLFIYFHLEKE